MQMIATLSEVICMSDVVEVEGSTTATVGVKVWRGKDGVHSWQVSVPAESASEEDLLEAVRKVKVVDAEFAADWVEVASEDAKRAYADRSRRRTAQEDRGRETVVPLRD